MFEMLTDYQIWVSLLTLTALEIVLGIDNLIFLSIVSGRLPKHQQQTARRIGLALALIGRLVLLFSLTWIIGLTEPIFTILYFDISWRDVVLIGGGAFLIAKGTMETHHMLEGHEEEHSIGTVTFASAVVQIIFLDVVFALDSIITAVGMAEHLWVMVVAVVIAMIVMLVAADPLANFIRDNPTVVMLALGFLLLIGAVLIADGFGVHVPKGYIYTAMAFSAGVEGLNIWSRRRQARAAASGDR